MTRRPWVGHQAVLEALVELADEELQRRRWLATSGPEVGSLVEAICQLINDSGLGLVLEAGGQAYGSEIDERLAALGRVLQRLDAGRPPAELLEDPAMVQVRQQAAEIVRALAARELRERIDGFVDGPDRSPAAAAAIEGLVILHFTEEPWFDDVSLALATFVPGGGQHYLDEDALADALAGVELEAGSA